MSIDEDCWVVSPLAGFAGLAVFRVPPLVPNGPTDQRTNGPTGQPNGVTLIELVVSTVIAVLIAGGTLVAFGLASKLSQFSSDELEAAHLAQQTVERFRNRIACDDPSWFVPASCTSSGDASTDALPSSSSLNKFAPAARQYTMTPGPDLDLDGKPDYYQMQVVVNWNPPK